MVFIIDPWAGKSEQELKERLGELLSECDRWQHIAMSLATNGGSIDALPNEWKQKLSKLISAYED